MRCVALLRAINVGGRVVRMDDLRRLFSSLGLSNVRTFIASGNVIFDAPARQVTKLETTIEKALRKAVGYEVATFLRTAPELVELAAHPLVSGAKVPDGCSLYVIFLRDELSPAAVRQVRGLATDVDSLDVHGRHVLWTVRGRLSDSKVAGARLDRSFDAPGTVRNATTVRKLAKIVSPEASG